MAVVQIQDLLVLIFCVVVHLVYRYRRKRLLPLPPGLPRWPLIGNAFDMPLQDTHIFYKELGKRLGTKIIYLEVLGRPIIILNDIAMAQELLEKRSSLYSSRPSLPMFTEVVGFTKLFSLMPYGDEWRIHRRMFQQYFSERNLSQTRETGIDFLRKGLLPNLYQDPDTFEEHIRNFIGGVSTSVTYGLPVQRRNDPVVRYTEKALLDGSDIAASGKYLVNIIPQLKYVPEWMPGAHFKKVAREVREELDELMNRPYRESLSSINTGTARESFVSATLERYHDKPDFDLQALYTKETAVQVFGAASETTRTATTTFILAMLTNPDAQRLAQKEIDSVVGRDRLPEFSDLKDLQYLSAVIKEVLRWNPVVPAGVPHLTSNKDVYDGYYIPKNCMIIPNAYAMLHDENVFPDPEEFRPSRFLRSDGTIRDDLPDPENIASFGFGRRICPGREIALSMLHITAVSILHLFDIRPALDDNGHPINVKPEFFTASLTSNPVPFRCKITPRGGIDVESLLQEYFGTDPM